MMATITFNPQLGWRYQQAYKNDPIVFAFWITGPQCFYQPQRPLWASYVVIPQS